jgi:hypothetical protein
LICESKISIGISFTISKLFFKLVCTSKPSSKLRGEFIQGELLFSQRKNIWNGGGEEFQILKMLLAIIFLYLSLFAKDFEKVFQKDLQKQTSGANVVQNVK